MLAPEKDPTAPEGAKPRRHDDKLIFMAVPCADGRMHMKTAMAILNAAIRDNVRAEFASRSALANNFNCLWCDCLNAKRVDGTPFTHFLMLHNDLFPVTADWLSVLLDEAERVDADVISAIAAIKDHQGVTSTAIHMDTGDPNHPWIRRRLTMHELEYELPETFNRKILAQCFGLDGTLLINTGLLLIDLRKPWPYDRIVFTQQDRIYRTADGRQHAVFEPEDWDFSKQAEKLGASVWATRKVITHHVGSFEYPSEGAWGTCRRDPGRPKHMDRPQDAETEESPAETAGMLTAVE